MAQILFNPGSFTAPQAKPMPVILVLDNSGSMSGEKIGTLNAAVREMLETFKESACPEAVFNVAIVTFGTGIHLFQEMTDADSVNWQDIAISDTETCKSLTGKWDDAAARGTPLGTTLKIVKSLIEDKTIIPSRAYRPAVILVSDGHPTDSWDAQLRAFIREGRSSKCDRWAMAIGRDADAKVLERFLEGATNPDGTQRKLLYAKDAKTLRDNFKFITMTVTNTVAVASKSKVLTVKPVTATPTGIDEQPPDPGQNPDSSGDEKETDSGFEW